MAMIPHQSYTTAASGPVQQQLDPRRPHLNHTRLIEATGLKEKQ